MIATSTGVNTTLSSSSSVIDTHFPSVKKMIREQTHVTDHDIRGESAIDGFLLVDRNGGVTMTTTLISPKRPSSPVITAQSMATTTKGRHLRGTISSSKDYQPRNSSGSESSVTTCAAILVSLAILVAGLIMCAKRANRLGQEQERERIEEELVETEQLKGKIRSELVKSNTTCTITRVDYQVHVADDESIANESATTTETVVEDVSSRQDDDLLKNEAHQIGPNSNANTNHVSLASNAAMEALESKSRAATVAEARTVVSVRSAEDDIDAKCDSDDFDCEHSTRTADTCDESENTAAKDQPLCNFVFDDDNHVRPTSDECAICLDRYKVGDCLIFATSDLCVHSFHLDCMVDYLAKTNCKNVTCPKCRQVFSASNKADMA